MTDLVADLTQWVRGLYAQNPWAKGAVIGMSGGRDCLAAAKICCNALGKDRVYGVIIPNGEMSEILDAIYQCKYLGIRYTVINMQLPFNSLTSEIGNGLSTMKCDLSRKSLIHLEPRLRMSILYAVAGSTDSMVVNTTSLTKAIMGSATKWGDNVGDFAPLINVTKTEIIKMLDSFMLPEFLVNNTDKYDLEENTDEFDLEYRYEEIDYLIRYGDAEDKELSDRIRAYFDRNKHKRIGTIAYDPDLPVYLK